MSERSPRPWKADRFNQGIQIWNSEAGEICIIRISSDDVDFNQRCEANAEFIVRACNSHRDLLAALLDQTCEGCGIRFDTPSDFPCKSCEQTRAAIAKAELPA